MWSLECSITEEKERKWTIFLCMLLENQGSLVETSFHFRTNQPLHFLLFYISSLKMNSSMKVNIWMPDLLFQSKPAVILGIIPYRSCQGQGKASTSKPLLSPLCLEKLAPHSPRDSRGLAVIIVLVSFESSLSLGCPRIFMI